MIPEDRQPLLLVAGMHRSGTSLLATALARLGMALGDPANLMGAAPSNIHGHGELFAVARLNDAVLAAAGAHWAAPLAISPERFDELADGELGARARSMIDHELADVQLIKDPRLCLLLPFWRSVLEPVRSLIVLTPWRHPDAVARSLEHRNDLPTTYGERLWREYHRRLATDAAGLPRHVVAHRAVVDDSVPTLAAIRDWLAEQQLTIDAPNSETIAVDKASVHHESTRSLTAVELELLDAVRRDETPAPDRDPAAAETYGAVAAFANQRDHFRFKLNEARARSRARSGDG